MENESMKKAGKEWSWGAFMFDPVFLVATRQYKYLLLYLLFLMPIVNIIAAIGLKLYFGMNGRKLLDASTAFKTDEERRGFLRAFDWAGKVFFWISVALLGLWLLFGALVLSFLGSTLFFGGLFGGHGFDRFDRFDGFDRDWRGGMYDEQMMDNVGEMNEAMDELMGTR